MPSNSFLDELLNRRKRITPAGGYSSPQYDPLSPAIPSPIYGRINVPTVEKEQPGWTSLLPYIGMGIAGALGGAKGGAEPVKTVMGLQQMEKERKEERRARQEQMQHERELVEMDIAEKSRERQESFDQQVKLAGLENQFSMDQMRAGAELEENLQSALIPMQIAGQKDLAGYDSKLRSGERGEEANLQLRRDLVAQRLEMGLMAQQNKYDTQKLRAQWANENQHMINMSKEELRLFKEKSKVLGPAQLLEMGMSILDPATGTIRPAVAEAVALLHGRAGYDEDVVNSMYAIGAAKEYREDFQAVFPVEVQKEMIADIDHPAWSKVEAFREQIQNDRRLSAIPEIQESLLRSTTEMLEMTKPGPEGPEESSPPWADRLGIGGLFKTEEESSRPRPYEMEAKPAFFSKPGGTPVEAIKERIRRELEQANRNRFGIQGR